jgi:hypothetical protein
MITGFFYQAHRAFLLPGIAGALLGLASCGESSPSSRTVEAGDSAGKDAASDSPAENTAPNLDAGATLPSRADDDGADVPLAVPDDESDASVENSSVDARAADEPGDTPGDTDGGSGDTARDTDDGPAETADAGADNSLPTVNEFDDAGCRGCICQADFSCNNDMMCSREDLCVGTEWSTDAPSDDFHSDRSLIWDEGEWQ